MFDSFDEPPPPPPPDERRRERRVVPPPELLASAVIVAPLDLGGHALDLLDLSGSGLGVGVVPGLPEPDIGTHVVVDLFLPDTPVPCRVKGLVRNRLHEGGVTRIGIQFDAATLGIGDKHQRVFREYLKRCRDARTER